jgi:hypothetical protein
MAGTRDRWFPDARGAQFAMIGLTTKFMSDDANRIRIGFGISTPNGVWYDSDYIPQLNIYNNQYSLWVNLATRTQLARYNLKDAENTFFPMYRKFHSMVRISPLVTNADLEWMGFPPRFDGKRSRCSVDKMFINVFAIPLGSSILKVSFHDRDISHVPRSIIGALISFDIDDVPITNPNKLTQVKLATRSPHNLSFDPKYRGKMASIAARWQNQRGEMGPWSEIINCIIA